MARIRTIKPEIALHEELYELGQETGLPIRFSWAVLPCHCDREGRFSWRPRRLGAQILPYDGIDFSRVLHALATRGFIFSYRVNDAWYGVIPTFHKHQVVNNRESDSEIPPAEEADEIWPADSDTSTRAPRVDDACPTRDVHAQAEGKGREGNGRENTPRASKKAAPTKPEGVSDEVWKDALDHRKRMKAPLTETAWKRMEPELRALESEGWSPDDVIAEWLAAGWRAFKADWIRNRGGGGKSEETNNPFAGAL